MKFGRFLCLLFLVGGMAVGQRAFGQTNCSYVIVSVGGYTQAQIDQAFSTARLDAYRLKTGRRSMQFTNGAEIHLYSATELQNMNCPVNAMLAMEDDAPLDPTRRFEIHPSGVIIEPVQAVYKQ
jgi:hypothetical protein